MNENCPKCGVTWEGQEIPAALMTTGYYPILQDAEIAAAAYGWTPENKRTFSINVTGIETAHYDGVSYWRCEVCRTLFDRFTFEEVPNVAT
jgi:hypothetical protein